jgi:hypothetical protein
LSRINQGFWKADSEFNITINSDKKYRISHYYKCNRPTFKPLKKISKPPQAMEGRTHKTKNDNQRASWTQRNGAESAHSSINKYYPKSNRFSSRPQVSSITCLYLLSQQHTAGNLRDYHSFFAGMFY